MKWVYNDGGRAAAGYKGHAGDCAARAIAIAAEIPYQQAYDLINGHAKDERRKRKSSARSGVYRPTMHKVMESLGWKWTPTMLVGQGCRVHLRDGELPGGRLIVNLSKHYAAVVDGVIHDIYDPSRDGSRCVYGYWRKEG